ncbi:retrovirus-related Pol polyprotein from transposon RE1 [Trichonephila clavipes]|nr:retrovirus-related Pol polyprotein from transposon RE1 [Trichonephila clavipes]
MATGSYLTPTYSRSQTRASIQGPVRHLKKSDPNFYDLLVLFFQSRSMISMKGCWQFIIQTKPEQPDEEATYKEKLDLQLRKDRCYTLIYTNISSDLKNLITETTDGVAAWKILKDHFEPVTRARVIQLLDQFFGTKYQPGEDVGIFISRVKTAATRLQEAGHKLDDLYIGFQLIRWLTQEFQSTVQQIYRWKEEDFRVVKIEAELILEANRLQLMKQDLEKAENAYLSSFTSKKSKTLPGATAAAHGDPNGKNDYQKKGGKVFNCKTIKNVKQSIKTIGPCYVCNKYGHLNVNCKEEKSLQKSSTVNETFNTEFNINLRFYEAECSLLELDKQLVTSCILFEENSVKGVWVIDTAATSHFCNDKSLFLDLKPITNMKMSLATEDKSCPVEGIGTLRFRKVNSNLGYNLNLPDYYDDEDDFDRVKDSLTSRLVSKTSTEMPSTSEKPDVSSDNHSLIPCTEVKWIRNIGRKVTGSNVYYSIEGEATRLKSFNEIERYCKRHNIEYDPSLFNFRKDNTESQGFSDLPEQQEALMVEVTIPNCYKQAIRSRDASKWHDAMDKEINVMKERKVWDLVDHTDNIKILENRWVYTIKYDENNKIVRYKARLVARDSVIYMKQPTGYEIDNNKVYDMIIFGKEMENVNFVLQLLQKNFDLKIMGKTKKLLGIEFEEIGNSLFIHQRSYIRRLCEIYEKYKYPVSSLPISKGQVLSKLDSPKTSEEILTVPYRNLMGSLSFIAIRTRPDIMYAEPTADIHTAPHGWSSQIPLLSSEAKTNFRYQQGAHGWSSENNTQSVTRGSKSWFFNCRLPLAWHSCIRSACDQSTLPIDVQVFHCKARDPHVEAWRVGCHLSCPPRHSTEVPNHRIYERRVRYIG